MDEQEQFEKQMRQQGELDVRAQYESDSRYGGDNRPRIRKWLLQQEAERATEATRREGRALRAAERSANATLAATIAASFSALCALVALVISVWPPKT